ncbi:MAG: TetR/AcrR family transcriptional regulator [Mogibacterium sp.]|nr:TetR/AcrR family transcriptional regulator [Mogibacterium sp.]
MDIRQKFTKKIIRETFLAMLEEMSLQKITVKELCARAEINRATFYKYYQNPEDLLEALEREQLDSLQQKLDKADAGNLQDIFRVTLSDIKENYATYKIIFSENGDMSFREKIFALCYDENMKVIRSYFPTMQAEQQEWLYYFIAEGCNGVLNRWMAGGSVSSIDEVIDFVEKIIADINISLPKSFVL